MAELEHRRQLLRGRADAAIPHGFAGRADAHADRRAVGSLSSATPRLRWPAPPTRGNSAVGGGPNQSFQAYGNPGAAAGGPQLLSNLASVDARRRRPKSSTTTTCSRSSTSTPTWTGATWAAVGHGRREDHGRGHAEAAARHHHRAARPGRHHGDLVLPAGPGHDLRGRAGLPADGRQFPVVAGSRSSS